MNESSVKCPKCGAMIELSEAFKNSIQDELRTEFNQKWIEEKKKLDEERKNIDIQIASERQQMEVRLKKRYEDQMDVQMKNIQNELNEKSKKLKESQDKELQLLRRQRELEDKEQSLQIDMERKLSAERAKINEEAKVKIGEEYKFKDAEKEKTIHDLLKQIEELRRKAEQGSQQLQGEVLEMEMEEQLKLLFPYDEIESVKKGFKGGDMIQRIFNDYKQPCGAILWEAKRTKNWDSKWIDKLKQDQIEAKANVSVIVSMVIPKDMNHIGNIDQVWICDFASAAGLAMVLRSGLIEIARAQTSIENKNEKMEFMYNYLSGTEFRQRIEAIVDAFVNMKTDLDAEKRAMDKVWAKREKQIERVMQNTTRLYGSLQGIIGQSLKPIPQLEFPVDPKEIDCE